MRAMLIGVSLMFTAFLTSCEDGQNSSTNDPLAPSSVALSAVVDRFPLDGGFTLRSIPDLGITFTIGLVTPIGDLSECGGPVEQFVSDSRGVNQTVSTPPGPDRNLDRIQGTLVLYDAVLTSDEDFCNLPTAEIGRGPGISINTDNDVHLDGPGADAFGGTLTATLDLTSGGRAHLLLVTRAVVLPDGSFETKVDRFELKPIGG